MLAPRAAGWYNIACKIVPEGLTAMQIAAMMLSKQQAASSKQGKSALFWHFWKPRARAIQAGARGFLHIKTGLEGAFEQGRRNTK